MQAVNPSVLRALAKSPRRAPGGTCHPSISVLLARVFATHTMWPRLSYASGGHGTTTMKNYSSLPVRRREVQVDITQRHHINRFLVLRHRRVQQIVPEHQ